MVMQPWGRRQTPKSLRWWVESDTITRAIIVGSVLTVLGALAYAWMGPVPQTSTLIALCALPIFWIYDLVRHRRR